MPVVAASIAADKAAHFLSYSATTASSHVGKFTNAAHVVRAPALAFYQVSQMPQLSLRILQ